MQKYIIASDGTNTSRATAKVDIFKTAILATATAGNTTTGISSAMIDISSAEADLISDRICSALLLITFCLLNCLSGYGGFSLVMYSARVERNNSLPYFSVVEINKEVFIIGNLLLSAQLLSNSYSSESISVLLI